MAKKRLFKRFQLIPNYIAYELARTPQVCELIAGSKVVFTKGTPGPGPTT